MASVPHSLASISEDFTILCDEYTKCFALMWAYAADGMLDSKNN